METSSYTPVRVFYGGKSQQSSSQVSVPPEVLAQYQNVNSIANQVAQTPFQQYSTDPNAFVAGLTPTQQGGILGTNQYSNTAQPFYQEASNTTNAAVNPSVTNQSVASTQGVGKQAGTAGGLNPAIQAYQSPYLKDVINPTSALMQQQFQQAQSSQLGNAIQNGAFGGDRAAVAAANLQQQQALAYGQTIGGLENQNYSQALGAAQQQQGVALGAAQQAGALSQGQQSLGLQQGAQQANIGQGAQTAGLAGAQAQLTAGQAQQQTEQAGLTALYNQFLQQQSYPFQTTQFLGNIAEGTGSLSGSTTTSNQPAPFFSDERLKENIQPIGKLFDGQEVIKYNYKGEKQKHVGLSAQDVERHHPEAVGLAGGYKTVDYDAATKDAARRRSRDAGGFLLDPSYLEAQEQSYSASPWGNAGLGVSATPYGGKSHVPPSMGGGHAQLAVAKTPSGGSGGGLGGMASSLGQLESLGKSGKSLWNDAKDSGLGGLLGGGSTPSVGAPAPVQPAEAQPAANSNTSPPANSNDASVGSLADASGLVPDFSSLADDTFAARGGMMHRDSGGPTSNQPTDAGSDDSSQGGDVPYDSGTGMQGLGIPDDRNNNHLAVAQPPQQQSGGGLGDVLGTVGKIASFAIPFLAKGGRVGLAGGGDPIQLPGAQPPQQVGEDLGVDNNVGLSPSSEHHWGPWHANGTPTGPIVADPSDALGDITVHKAAPSSSGNGLNPDAPSPDAQPVQAMQDPPGVVNTPSAPHVLDNGPPVDSQGLVPGAPPRQDTGGLGDWLGSHQSLLVPLLHGLGTMASSNSRYLGSAILQGLGGAADSYENTQNEMMNRGIGAANLNQTNAVTGQVGAATGRTNAETARALAEGLGDSVFERGGFTFVKLANGGVMRFSDWDALPSDQKASHPLMFGAQASAAAGASPGRPAAPTTANPPATPVPNLGGSGVAAQPFKLLGPNGQSSAANDYRIMSRIPANSAGYNNMMDTSRQTEAALQSKYQSAVTTGASLNQITDELLHIPNKGALAPGALNQAMQGVLGQVNGLATASGHPEWQIQPNELGTEQAINKLTAQMQFQRSQGADQHSMAALEIAGLATPGNYTTRAGQSKILAGLYALNQQDLDPYNYLQEYKRQAQSTSPRPDWYLAQNAMSQFNKEHNATEYQHLRQGMQDILSGKYDAGQTTPMFDHMLNGTLPPAAQKLLEQKYGVKNFGRVMRNE